MDVVRLVLQTLVDNLLWLLPDVDKDNLQSMAAVGTLLVTVVLAAATLAYTLATKRMMEMQADEGVAKSVPLVVLDLGKRSALGDPFNYMVVNIGRGGTLNAFELDGGLQDDDSGIRVLGALLPGQQALVPDGLNTDLRAVPQNILNARAYFVVAQPAVGTEWIATVNRLDTNGRVSHEVLPWKPSEKIRERMRMVTMDEQLTAYYRANVQP